jgi:hypothetical protein
MNRILVSIALAVVVTLSGCSSANKLTSMASNPLISSLTSSIPGLDATKAIGAAGSYLAVAEGKLSEADYDAMIDVIPGGKDIKQQALSLGGMDKIMGISDANSLMAKLGVTKDQGDKVAAGMTDYISKQGKPDVADKFKKALM